MCREGKVHGPCHCILDLVTFGLEGEGCIADKEWLNSLVIPSHVSKTNPACVFSSNNKSIYTIEPISSGKFGYIEGGLREQEDNKKLVIIKRPQQNNRDLLQEALVQKIVYESLKKGGFPHGAPDVYDIFSLNNGSICFTMDTIRGEILQPLINRTIGLQLMNTIIESLFHICSMIWHLENDIGMNHRDLKPSNIIIQPHRPCKKSRTVGKQSVILVSNFDVTFIDFGFSCIGLNGKGGGLKMSESYSEEDPCPKEGRDMYMFLCFIYYYTHRKMSVDFDKLFQKWLNVSTCKMTDILKSPKTPKEHEDIVHLIYCVTGDPEVVRLHATPECVFHDLLKFKKII